MFLWKHDMAESGLDSVLNRDDIEGLTTKAMPNLLNKVETTLFKIFKPRFESVVACAEVETKNILGIRRFLSWCVCMAVIVCGEYGSGIAYGKDLYLQDDASPQIFCEYASNGMVTVRGVVMGTVFTVRAYPGEGMNVEEATLVCREALICAKHWEKVMSAMDAESELAQLNAAECEVPVPISPELERVLLDALEYARMTNGFFDPTLGPCIRLWKKSRRLGSLPSEDALQTALRTCGWKKLIVNQGSVQKTVSGMSLDLGGIGKGFAVDRMAEVLRRKGVRSFLIDTTSDVFAGNAPPGKDGWRLKVESGDGDEHILLLNNAAVSTSGSAHQFVKIDGKVYSHVLNPLTGLGMEDGRQVSVMAPSAELADVLATVGCVMGQKSFELFIAPLSGVRIIAFSRKE